MEKPKNEEGTIITVSSDLNNFKEGLETLTKIIKKAIGEITNKEGLKIITSTDLSKKGYAYHNVFINRKLDLDIKKEWQHGQTYIDQIETTDRCQKTIEYICN